MNDALLLGGILVFIFVLWLYSGGPNHPIAFSGPYLTPITNVNQESIGYGPSANEYISSGSGSVIDRPLSANTQTIDSARSPFEGRVRLEGGTPGATNERDEYLVISTSDAVTITGWRLVSASGKTTVRIPEGSRGASDSKRSIALEPGNEAFISTGSRRSGEDTFTTRDRWYVYLDKSDDIWSSSDTITLLDSNGKVVDQYRY